MLARPHKFLLIALAGVMLSGLVFALKTPVRVYDRRFRVAGFGVSATVGKDQVVYSRSRFLGRVQEGLAKLGLGIRPPLKFGYTMGIGKDEPPATFIAVAYRGELTERELGAVRGWLVNGDGNKFSLDRGGGLGGSGICRGKFYYYGCWFKNLNSPHRMATNSSTWILRLQSEEGAKLADITFRNQQK